MQTIKKKGYAARHHQEQGITTIANKVSAALSGYTKQLVIAAYALVAVLLIIAIYSLVLSRQERKAAPLVAAAYEYYSPTSGTNGDFQKALGLFRDVRKNYSGTKSGAVAQYYIGNCLVSLGQPDEAIKEYEAFVKKYSGEKLLLGLVYQRMGYVYGMLGKQAEAVKAFEQSEAVAGPGLATIELARLYEASGNIPESQKKYKLVLDKLGNTSWGMEATEKVQKIEPAPQPAGGKPGK